jgi:hypothetical protein
MKSHICLLGVIFGLFAAGAGQAQTVGMQFIGGSSTPAGDMTISADLLARHASTATVEVAFLPFEFTPRSPLVNMTRLAENFVARSNKKLRITIHLKWFVHDPVGNADAREFWDAWAAARPTNRQQTIRNNYMQRVNDACNWVRVMRSSPIAGRLNFTCVPVLEDVCHTQAGYKALVAAIRARQTATGAGSFPIRRSCLPAYVFRGTFDSLEVHGTWASVKGYLRSGDAYSNDGDEQTAAAFGRDAKLARAAGVSALYWRPAYNGQPYRRDNWASRTVNPFTGQTGPAEQAALQSMLAASR